MTPRAAAAPDPNIDLSALTDRDFDRVAKRLGEMAGIVLESHKRQMIVSRLSRRLRSRGFASFSDYLDYLDKGQDKAELQEFVNTLTTNLTSFFREGHHFRHFKSTVLGAGTGTMERLRVWSAGCSSGEEPYSIALTILEAQGRIGKDVRILATDLDTNVLDRGKAGAYPAERVEGLPKTISRMLNTSADGSIVKMPTAAREAISFRQLNLLEPWPMRGKFEAIFCRNVMIYFDTPTKAALLDRFSDMLTPGGFLYLGHSESILGLHAKLTSRGETIYQRSDT